MSQPNPADLATPGSSASHSPTPSLTIAWSAAYQPQWDHTPGAYHEHDIVGWGRSRRLARAQDPSHAFKAYLGIQHADPSRWHVSGEPRAVFFLSLFVHNHTVTLRTFPTFPDALAALHDFHARLTAS